MKEANIYARRISSFLLLIILITLGLSIIAFYQGVSAYLNDEPNTGNYLMLTGTVGLALSAYMLLQTRKRALRLNLQPQRISTTMLCQKCGFKNIQDFQRGDYIFKEAGACPKCNEKMVIASIYREVQEKEEKKGYFG